MTDHRPTETTRSVEETLQQYAVPYEMDVPEDEYATVIIPAVPPAPAPWTEPQREYVQPVQPEYERARRNSWRLVLLVVLCLGAVFVGVALFANSSKPKAPAVISVPDYGAITATPPTTYASFAPITPTLARKPPPVAVTVPPPPVTVTTSKAPPVTTTTPPPGSSRPPIIGGF